MTEGASAPTKEQLKRRWRRYYMPLWAGHAISESGSSVTYVVLPIMAVVTLGASPLQVGVLNGLEFASYLGGLSLVIGVLVDRMDRRRIMIVTDVLRALLVGAIVWLAFAGWLTLWWLFAIVAVLGVLGVVFTTASQAYLPDVVYEEQMGDAMTWHASTSTIAGLAGRSAGGVLIQFVSTAATLVIDAVSYVLSVFFVAAIPGRDTQAEKAARTPGQGIVKQFRGDITEGFGFIKQQPFLKGMLRFLVHSNFLMAAQIALTVPFLVREVGVSAWVVGLVLAVETLGAYVGATLAMRLIRNPRFGTYGPGRVFGVAATAGPCFAILLPLTTKGWGLAWFAIGLFGAEICTLTFNVITGTYRNRITTPHLRGRVQATMRTFFRSAIPIGAVLGGLLGELVGLRWAMVVVAGGMLLLPLWMINTPAWRFTKEDLGLK